MPLRKRVVQRLSKCKLYSGPILNSRWSSTVWWRAKITRMYHKLTYPISMMKKMEWMTWKSESGVESQIKGDASSAISERNARFPRYPGDRDKAASRCLRGVMGCSEQRFAQTLWAVSTWNYRKPFEKASRTSLAMFYSTRVELCPRSAARPCPTVRLWKWAAANVLFEVSTELACKKSAALSRLFVKPFFLMCGHHSKPFELRSLCQTSRFCPAFTSRCLSTLTCGSSPCGGSVKV